MEQQGMTLSELNQLIEGISSRIDRKEKGTGK